MISRILTVAGISGAIFWWGLFTPAVAQEQVRIQETDTQIPVDAKRPYVHVLHNGRSVKIQRVQDENYEVKGYWAQTVRKCPPFCIRAERADPSVETVGEVEVLDFLENQVRDGVGILVDARTPEWHKKGTIPGSINIPFTVFGQDDTSVELREALELLGGKPRAGVSAFTRKLEEWGFLDGRDKTERWDFSNAKQVMLWCNGMTCGQSPKAIEGLLHVGYPAHKIYYFRGGMQTWQLLALTTVQP
ncbi:MAG: rhodanese-like domain-containing protein [Chromatiales bacterium]|nr:rhodanese-like domain-containing protein [Chromatiales bacterium]